MTDSLTDRETRSHKRQERWEVFVLKVGRWVTLAALLAPVAYVFIRLMIGG